MNQHLGFVSQSLARVSSGARGWALGFPDTGPVPCAPVSRVVCQRPGHCLSCTLHGDF